MQAGLKHLAAVNITAGQNPAEKNKSIINQSLKKYFYPAFNTEVSFKGVYQKVANTVMHYLYLSLFYLPH